MMGHEWYHLPVADAIGVQVVESVEGLSHNECRLSLSQVLSLCNVEEKLATFAQSNQVYSKFRESHATMEKDNLAEDPIKELNLLSDKEADSLCLPSLMQLDNIRVVLEKQIFTKDDALNAN